MNESSILFIITFALGGIFYHIAYKQGYKDAKERYNKEERSEE